MSDIVTIGQVPWTRVDMIGKLDEFHTLYNNRPIKDNTGGMRSVHMFLMWFALKTLKPKAVIESGVWLGAGTWFIEKACPHAKIYCIDLNLDRIKYRSNRAEYLGQDFSTIDWSHLPKSETLLFFDDHQNAYERVKTAKWFGFEDIIFEDNYPPLQGDCYSLKKAFMHSGFTFTPAQSQTLKAKIKQKALSLLSIPNRGYREIQPNEVDEKYLRQNLKVYYEFPPIYKVEHTRWGDTWDGEYYPTPDPLLTSVEKDYQQLYKKEAIHYTWMCYVSLK